MSAVESVLPASERFRVVPVRKLFVHGVLLHVASLLGPLRASAAFRAREPRWVLKVGQRFWQEYGLNLMLLVVGWLSVAVLVPAVYQWVGVLAVVVLAPVLTGVQMLVDWLRGDVVLEDTAVRSAGVTVRTEVVEGVQVVRFFNHYGLPIGRRHGVALRVWLLQVAESGGSALVCRAQSQEVADYYLATHPGGRQLSAGKHPFLVWEFESSVLSASSFDVRRDGWFKAVIGWHTNRSSGQGF